jgi:hypothetical protein
MSKLRYTLLASLVSGTMLAALAAPGALLAAKPPKEGQDHKVYICHFPPGNPENVQPIAIAKSALAKHEDCHHDYLVESDVSECYLDGEPEDEKGGEGSGSAESEIFVVEACINRPGVRKGREITTHLSGAISNTKKFCER